MIFLASFIFVSELKISNTTRFGCIDVSFNSNVDHSTRPLVFRTTRKSLWFLDEYLISPMSGLFCKAFISPANWVSKKSITILLGLSNENTLYSVDSLKSNTSLI